MSTETSPGAGSKAQAPPQASPAAWRLVLLAVVGAEFMLQLDGTIVNVALPGAQADLGIGVTGASWVLNGFFLAFGGLLLLAGRLGDVLGHRRVFLFGIALVGVASLLAGLAPNFPVLLSGRVLQGAGAAIAGPTGLALLTIEFEGERQLKAFGLYSTVTGLGAASGMILGGILTWAGDWRWTLLVNVPIAAAVLLVANKVLSRGDAPTTRRSLGVPSSVLVTGALVGLVYGLVRAAEAGWSDTWTLVSLGAAVVLTAGLLAVDSKSAEPLLPLRVFASRERVGGFISLVLLAAVLTGFLFYTIQYLDAVLGFGALKTGFAILPFGLGILLTVQLLTKYLAGISLKLRGILGLVLVVGAVLWLTRLDGQSSYATDVLPQIVLLGLGVGLAIVPVNMTILSTTSPEDTGITAGILQAALTVGGTVGLAVLLQPFTAGDGNIAENISTLYTWAAGIAGAGLLVTLAFWFGPGTRKAESEVATGQEAAEPTAAPVAE
ncbi:MFS transporter [Streptomyces sp. RKAG290]|uniref:MFS transporter n=1 Tax=Streptomyces sp. RKAG290 TaxID=2888348 RepID=UPI0020334658|nr:MFS transporter [Streptomyces sp. RKAG290]MCM2410699.1 MFS transporter [Streptomyces sp. RKAG290]